jgi:hypothetical protein
MNYFVSPPDKTDLKIESAQFINRLKADWQNIDIRATDNQDYSLEWIIPIKNRRLEGSLERTEPCVVLDGDVRDCANFALWFRSLVERKYRLFFYDQAYSADIELREKTTIDNIMKLFMSNPIEEYSSYSLETKPILETSKDYPQRTVTLCMPENVLNDLKCIAPVFGFSSYQPLIQHYIGEGLRIDQERLNNPTIQSLIKSLKHHDVNEVVIARAIEEASH